ncbi:MAG TPA: hypothetical protein VGE51_07655, partial [Fontimonas sp.]
MKYTLKTAAQAWPMIEPFTIARGTQTTANVVAVEIGADGVSGRGEAAGVTYAGETQQTLLRDIESVRTAVEAGATREDLLTLLPAGGARNALDA